MGVSFKGWAEKRQGERLRLAFAVFGVFPAQSVNLARDIFLQRLAFGFLKRFKRTEG